MLEEIFAVRTYDKELISRINIKNVDKTAGRPMGNSLEKVLHQTGYSNDQ